jgi:ABC-2 type transport system permease protein
MKQSAGPGSSAARKLRYGGYAVLLTSVILAAVILANLALGLWEEHTGFRIDLSPQKITSVSGQTADVLKNLKEDVHIYPIYKAGTTSDIQRLMDETLDRYRALCAHILVETIDPATQPNRIAALAPEGGIVPEGSVFVTNADASRILRVSKDDFMYQRTLEGKVYTLYSGEIRFTAAVMNASASRTQVVGFLTGHGEIGPADCSVMKLQLEASGYSVITAQANAEALAGCDVLLLMAPQADLTEAETMALKKWLDAGGHMLAAYGAETPQDTLVNFGVLLDLYGLGFLKGQAVETTGNTDYYVDRPDLIKPIPAAGQKITDAIEQRLIMPAACAIALPGVRTGIETQTLLTTSAKAYRKADTSGDQYAFAAGDVSGTQVMALAATGPGSLRVILLASAEMLTDRAGITGADLLNASDNLKFLLASVNWLSGNGAAAVNADLKVIPSHMMTFENERQKQIASVLAAALLPVITLIAGSIMALRRRRL